MSKKCPKRDESKSELKLKTFPRDQAEIMIYIHTLLNHPPNRTSRIEAAGRSCCHITVLRMAKKKKKKVPDHRVNIFLRNSLSPVCSDLRHLSVSTDKSRSKIVTEYEQRELWYGKLLYRFKRVAVCIQNTDSTVGRILCQWMFSM